jgi:putative molybdopterin biosynthesis protein
VETAALSFGLNFKLLTTERYDLVIPAEKWELNSIQALKLLLETDQAKSTIANMGGYDTGQTGRVVWIN